MAHLIVLLGAPGSGKTSVGEALSRREVRWREWEVSLLERWGSREEFLEHKADALAQHHDEVLDWIRSDPAPCAIETTGLSDRDWIDGLRHIVDTVVVRLDVDEPTAISRMRARPRGRHLTDDPRLQRDVWTAFQALAAPAVGIDLAIDTTQIGADDAAELIAERFASGRDPER